MTLPPPPPELVEEVAPITIEKSPLAAPEEQSPTIMIEGLLSKLVLKEEATEAQGVMEEEGLSSTLERKMLRAIV